MSAFDIWQVFHRNIVIARGLNVKEQLNRPESQSKLVIT